MTNYYSIDGILTELHKRLSESESLLCAWKAVTFPTKKDGSPFKIMSKNISGAVYRSWEYAFNPNNEKELAIHIWDTSNGYVSDVIKCHEIARYLKDPAKIAKTQNLCPKESMLEQIYLYDLDDIKTAVSNRISQLEKRTEVLKTEIEKAPELYLEYLKRYNELRKYLSDNTDNEQHDLFYAIIGTVEKSY